LAIRRKWVVSAAPGRLDPRRAKVRRQQAGGLVFTHVTELALQVEAPQRRGVEAVDFGCVDGFLPAAARVRGVSRRQPNTPCRTSADLPSKSSRPTLRLASFVRGALQGAAHRSLSRTLA